MIDTKELRRLAQEATPGPWLFDEKSEAITTHSRIANGKTRIATVTLGWVEPFESEQLANARLIAAANPAAISELLDRLEAAESDGLEQARLNGMGAEREAALLAKLEAAEKEIASWKGLAKQFGNEADALRAKLEAAESDAAHQKILADSALRVAEGWERKCDALRVENEALRAEIIHIKEVEFPRKAQAVADGWRGKCERLEAKIAEMERQEPVGWQPIETAPRNQIFLAVLNCAGEQTICTMRWPVAEAKNSRPDNKAFHVERVTHWMPLPELPGAKGEEK